MTRLFSDFEARAICDAAAGRTAGAPSFGDSPATNSKPPGASEGTDGRGVSTNPLGSINRDKTGERMVRKGCEVSYYGLRMCVQRVRAGYCYGFTVSGRSEHFKCSEVKVVA